MNPPVGQACIPSWYHQNWVKTCRCLYKGVCTPWTHVHKRVYTYACQRLQKRTCINSLTKHTHTLTYIYGVLYAQLRINAFPWRRCWFSAWQWCCYVLWSPSMRLSTLLFLYTAKCWKFFLLVLLPYPVRLLIHPLSTSIVMLFLRHLVVLCLIVHLLQISRQKDRLTNALKAQIDHIGT